MDKTTKDLWALWDTLTPSQRSLMAALADVMTDGTEAEQAAVDAFQAHQDAAHRAVLVAVLEEHSKKLFA